MKTHILVTDDEPLTCKSLQEILRHEGYNVSTAGNGAEALEILKEYPVDIVITDLVMPNVSGIELLKAVKNEFPDTQVVVTTAFGNIENAVEAMRLGAFDYLAKPLDDTQIKAIIEKIVRLNEKKAVMQNSAAAQEPATASLDRFHHIIGKDEKMRRIYAMIEALANSPSTVLIYGESGTGKRMAAQAIHKADKFRAQKPFVEVSCGALPETLLESELFGHVRGAFTGAIKDRPGRFEMADGGTILLDEIDTCSPALQVKLLRVLEEGAFERVGDTKTLKADVRVIAATNQRLEELVKRRSFREDLYWRLNVISLHLPLLRERIVDIPLLADYFLHKYNHIRLLSGKSEVITDIRSEAMEAMLRYNWPGNVRELENTIERACILCRDNVIGPDDLPDSIRNFNRYPTDGHAQDEFSLKNALQTPEKDIILNALDCHNWNCSRAAESLGVNRTTLYNKMKKYGINRASREKSTGAKFSRGEGWQ